MRTMNLSELRSLVLSHYRRNSLASLGRVVQAFEHLASLAKSGSVAAKLGPNWGQIKANLAGINFLELTAYVDQRLDEGAALATIGYELSILRSGFRLAEKAGLAKCPVFPALRIRNARKVFIAESELRAILDQLPSWCAPVVEFLYLTGWRKGEALALRWSQVDLEAGLMTIETSKNGDGKTFPFKAYRRLRQLLEERRRWTGNRQAELGKIIPWVFSQAAPQAPTRAGERLMGLRKAWATACRRAGLPGRRIHDLRRSAARNMRRAGVSEHVILDLMGWRSGTMFQRYDIRDEADLAEGVERLAGLCGDHDVRLQLGKKGGRSGGL